MKDGLSPSQRGSGPVVGERFRPSGELGNYISSILVIGAILLVICGFKVVTADPIVIPVPGTPIVQTVVVAPSKTATPVWTQTPIIVMVLPTATSSPVIPFCTDGMASGTLCMTVPVARTATVLPECPPDPTYQFVCRKPDTGSGSAQETK